MGKKVNKLDFDFVDFVRIGPGVEAYRAGESIWSNYSRVEQELLFRSATEIIRSNRSKAKLHLLLNAEPGHYLAVGGSAHARHKGPGAPAVNVHYVFSQELVAGTEVTVCDLPMDPA